MLKNMNAQQKQSFSKIIVAIFAKFPNSVHNSLKSPFGVKQDKQNK